MSKKGGTYGGFDEVGIGLFDRKSCLPCVFSRCFGPGGRQDSELASLLIQQHQNGYKPRGTEILPENA
jgi:hypothetical protein